MNYSKAVNDKTIHKLQNLLLRAVLITIYKIFIRVNLDYGSIFLWSSICLFMKNWDRCAYLCLAIAGAVQGISRKRYFTKD